MLPDAIVQHVETLYIIDAHFTARLILRSIDKCIKRCIKVNEICESDLTFITERWNAISKLRIYDATIVQTCRKHHDILYQLLEDPYDMRFAYDQLMQYFQTSTERIMYRIIQNSQKSYPTLNRL